MSEQVPDPPATQSDRHSAVNGRPFRLLLAGSSVSLLGTRISTIAFPMLVLWMTHSPVAAGWTAFAATAPSVLVYVPAGALVDVWPPRRVMLISEFGRGVALFAVVIALLHGKAFLPLLIGAAIVEEILEVFSTLAERRYVGSLVQHDQASSALVQMEARTHVMVLVGRPLGGILFAAQPLLPFVADMLSFVISVSALVAIKGEQAVKLITSSPEKIFSRRQPAPPAGQQCGTPAVKARPRASREGLWTDIRGGLHWLRGDLFTCVSIILSAGTTLICQALIMIFLAYASDQHLPSFMIGIALAASGFGGAIGSVLASRLPAPVSHQWTLIRIAAWIIAVAVLVVPSGLRLIAPGEFLFERFAVVMIFLGFTGALGNVEIGTYLIQKAPEEMLARITSIGRLISFGACAVGPVLGGLVIQRYKILGAVLALSVAILALSAFSLLLPSTQTRKSRISKMTILALRLILFFGLTLAIRIVGGLLKPEPLSVNSLTVQLAHGYDGAAATSGTAGAAPDAAWPGLETARVPALELAGSRVAPQMQPVA
ncbi:MAG: MFS transporter [Streptosporangiaceae bacterium]